jgi:hypothetical protein
MVKRWPLLLVALAVVAVLAAWYRSSGEAIGPGGYSRVRLGMTEDEVTNAVRLPPGVYTKALMTCAVSVRAQKGLPFDEMCDREAGPGTVTRRDWSGDRYDLCVAFDGDGAAVGVYLFEVDRPSKPSSFLDRILDLDGL